MRLEVFWIYKKNKEEEIDYYSFILLTGCRRLEADGALVGKVIVVTFVSTISLSIWPVVVAIRRSNVGSV